ncbi:MAG: FAD-dependent oxidoreductase [candidate division NC10 bacterium]|nr:FAD-dependent oxidoreductase [candidate division NC10 bacterium]
MATRHLIVGGGTAGLNAIRTIRAHDRGESEIVLVSAERPYSRMVLPYYLGRSIAEAHVFTATPAHLAQLQVQAHLGRRAATLDPAANRLTLDDGTVLPYDDCLIATGSSAVRAPVPGADSPGVHSFWTLPQARGVVGEIREGSHVVLVGAGFHPPERPPGPEGPPHHRGDRARARAAHDRPDGRRDGREVAPARRGSHPDRRHPHGHRGRPGPKAPPVPPGGGPAGRRGPHGDRDPRQPGVAAGVGDLGESRDRRGRPPALERRQRLCRGGCR